MRPAERGFSLRRTYRYRHEGPSALRKPRLSESRKSHVLTCQPWLFLGPRPSYMEFYTYTANLYAQVHDRRVRTVSTSKMMLEGRADMSDSIQISIYLQATFGVAFHEIRFFSDADVSAFSPVSMIGAAASTGVLPRPELHTELVPTSSPLHSADGYYIPRTAALFAPCRRIHVHLLLLMQDLRRTESVNQDLRGSPTLDTVCFHGWTSPNLQEQSSNGFNMMCPSDS